MKYLKCSVKHNSLGFLCQTESAVSQVYTYLKDEVYIFISRPVVNKKPNTSYF